MEKKKIKELLNRYQTGQCTEEEKAWIETWYNNLLKNSDTELPESILLKDLHDIYNILPRANKIKIKNTWLQIAAAAILILSISTGLYIYTRKPLPVSYSASTPLKINEKDFAPGKNKTFLTLANGSKIFLEPAPIGEIAIQGGIRISKIKEGVIAYTRISNQNIFTRRLKTNSITTSKGGQYQVILVDGTSVWLNALSTLKFPASFSGRHRKVELNGEGYFEVTKNKARPFKVLTRQQEVEVLGTHFNINSYEDEPDIKTTLLEGSVKVSELKTHKSALLKPGEQSTLKNSGKILVGDVKTDNIIAWKNGLFRFQNSDIQNIARQLARWYDVDFEFQGPIPDIKLWGEVHRNINALKALETLSYFGLKYSVITSGSRKKIIITK